MSLLVPLPLLLKVETMDFIEIMDLRAPPVPHSLLKNQKLPHGDSVNKKSTTESTLLGVYTVNQLFTAKIKHNPS
jgi:hypothetical protein